MKKVLIVDDDSNIVLSLDFLLRKAGYTVLIARDGEEAIESIETHQPLLVVLDIRMPKVDGFGVVQYLKSKPLFKQIKIIILSAKGRDADIERAASLGVDQYMLKPFSTRTLLANIQLLLA
ncbi:response regulator transcription factor [Olivibacter sp. XZL3]|uniref:response regulator transcription factor n=1 Tax=Olivibacter sp. XZL3 TaxID=1735116 RepID=UPI00106648CE|nr:response regulator [Olivibacter sp. XZL3]